jgi:hypothetical protein
MMCGEMKGLRIFASDELNRFPAASPGIVTAPQLPMIPNPEGAEVT